MTWTALADSGIGFTPTLPVGVTLTGSTVTGVRRPDPGDQSWMIALASAAKIRVTVQDFDSTNYPGSGAFVFGYSGGVSEMIQNEGGIGEWSPNPVVSGAAVTYVAYDPGEQSDYPQDSYTMLVEVDVAPAVVRPRVISHVLRAYAAADTPVTAWIRGEAGAVDLSGSDLMLWVTPYKGSRIAGYPATGSQAGEVLCTIPAEFGRKHGTGVYRFDVVDAVAGVIAIGILEVV